jgi:type II secretory pathway pseudopilin PulG
MGSIAARLRSRLVADDEGLGLIEIVVSMFILAALALSLLPLLITGMKASVANTTLAAATQFANDRINTAQNIAATSTTACSDVTALSATPTTMLDARGIELKAVATVGSCPTGVGTMRVSIAVSRTDTGAVLSRASTAVLVKP